MRYRQQEAGLPPTPTGPHHILDVGFRWTQS